MLYVWGKFVYVRGTIDLRTEGCTFTRVAFFVCVWINPLSVGVSRVRGASLRPRLNGVLMALEGGGSGKVRVPVPEGKIGEK